MIDLCLSTLYDKIHCPAECRYLLAKIITKSFRAKKRITNVVLCIPFQIARLVKVTQTDSPYFKIISPHDVGHKVAPGMDTTFIVQFTPDEKKVCN